MAEIEKVIEDLESIKRTLYNLTGSHRNERKVDKAIRTIRELQSKSEEVCEWKSASDGEFIQNPHTKRLYSNEPSMHNVYCNTCGKKIKVGGVDDKWIYA